MWIYPFERNIKTLKDYIRAYAHPKGSMAEGYFMEDTLGFCKEYLSCFTITHRRMWDVDEEQSMYDEVLEGNGEKIK
jgi:hypothetical protein